MIDIFVAAPWLLLLAPVALAVAIVLIVDLVTVLRGGYSLFTPPVIMMLGMHMKACNKRWRT